jgi:hypothetical protein
MSMNYKHVSDVSLVPITLLSILVLMGVLIQSCEELEHVNPNDSSYVLISPSSINTEVKNESEIIITWLDNGQNEVGFIIERDSGSGFGQIGEVNADVTEYTDSGLFIGISYTYRVKAFSGDNFSQWASSSATLIAFPAPSNLSAQIVSYTEILLTWTDNSSWEIGFIVERNSGAGFVELTRLDSNTIQYIDNDLTENVEYTYRISAYTNQSVSDQATSNSVGIHPLNIHLDHIYIEEIVLQPSAGEYVLITNPTLNTVELSDYYLTDATDKVSNKYYYNLPSGIDCWSGSSTDFIARFPDMSIGAGASLILSMARTGDYEATYGMTPDLALKDDMLNAIDGQTTIGGSPNVKLDNTAESLILFYWDGNSNSIQDVEYLIWGTDYSTASAYMIDKTGIGSYHNDTAINNQSFMPTHLDGFKLIRTHDEGLELTSGGNGFTGHDETSEDFAETWSVVELTTVKPDINNITIMPDTPLISEEMVVTVDVLDESGISSVVLTYMFPLGVAGGIELVMHNESDNTWEAIIPATGYSGDLAYFITATNASGLVTVSTIMGVTIG